MEINEHPIEMEVWTRKRWGNSMKIQLKWRNMRGFDSKKDGNMTGLGLGTYGNHLETSWIQQL